MYSVPVSLLLLLVLESVDDCDNINWLSPCISSPVKNAISYIMIQVLFNIRFNSILGVRLFKT